MAPSRRARSVLRATQRRLAPYGMLSVLLLLCLFFASVTLRPQHPQGEQAAVALARIVAAQAGPSTSVLIVARAGGQDSVFTHTLAIRLTDGGIAVSEVVQGPPIAVRAAAVRFADQQANQRIVATLESSAPVVHNVLQTVSGLADARVLTPPARRWPTFLLPDNLRNIANQIAVIAIVAVGMTLVIITGGIDLSVGSLIALSAVIATWLIARLGAEGAGITAMLVGAAGATLVCGVIGAFSALMITRFRVPPFIATLGMMQVASGLAYIIAHGRPIYQLPDAFVALGRGADPLFQIPYAVYLMLGLYVGAHLIMSRTVLGRYIYAVGGNAEAARLAGVHVGFVLLMAYLISGMLAGVGGVVMASQLKSGAPTYGLMYELFVIAAVVVGGTSLRGGEGRIFGTLIGAFIIAVIQNGMNLTNVESYTQKVVLGLVILGAVLLDRLRGKRRGKS